MPLDLDPLLMKLDRAAVRRPTKQYKMRNVFFYFCINENNLETCQRRGGGRKALTPPQALYGRTQDATQRTERNSSIERGARRWQMIRWGSEELGFIFVVVVFCVESF